MAVKVTNKKPLFGNRRSHACNATRHAQKPNVQKVTLDNGLKIRISARELRTLKRTSNISVNNVVDNVANTTANEVEE